MPSGLPDFWQGTIAGMPTIGAGQVAWFLSEAALVGAEGEEDLISYVVPDLMELHVCSGVVSCSFPVLQRYKLITTPATWVSPASHIDPDDKWLLEERAYDNNIVTSAVIFPVVPESWSSYLILLLNEERINRVKFYAWYEAVATDVIDIDVYYEGDWHDVYEGVYANREWVEKSILPSKLISKARIRFYNKNLFDPMVASLNEFMFNTSGETPQEGIYFDTHSIIPYLPQAPYIVPAGATFLVRVYNDDDAAHNMAVSLAGFLQSKA